MEIDPKVFGEVCGLLIADHSVRSATKFLDEKTMVRVTWRLKPRARASRSELAVTFGAPNYLERQFIKNCKKAGEPVPVKKIQTRPWPKKKEK